MNSTPPKAPQKSSPLASVAMCTFNGERFLKEQLDSLIVQSHPNLEIIICDDQSTDRTIEILKEYAHRDRRIQIHQNKINLGFLKNFETCIAMCNGDYIALCDQDDVWMPNKISTLLKNIKNHALIYTATGLIDKDGLPQGNFLNERNRLSGRCNRALLLDNCVTGHTCLFPKKLIAEILPFPAGITYHDHWIAFVASTIGTIHCHPTPLSAYRQHEDNVSIDLAKTKQRVKSAYIQKIRARQRKRKTFLRQNILRLQAFKQLRSVGTEDQQLIDQLIKEFERSSLLFYNNRLKKLIHENPELLDLFTHRPKALKRYCSGAAFRF